MSTVASPVSGLDRGRNAFWRAGRGGSRHIVALSTLEIGGHRGSVSNHRATPIAAPPRPRRSARWPVRLRPTWPELCIAHCATSNPTPIRTRIVGPRRAHAVEAQIAVLARRPGTGTRSARLGRWRACADSRRRSTPDHDAAASGAWALPLLGLVSRRLLSSKQRCLPVRLLA